MEENWRNLSWSAKPPRNLSIRGKNARRKRRSTREISRRCASSLIRARDRSFSRLVQNQPRLSFAFSCFSSKLEVSLTGACLGKNFYGVRIDSNKCDENSGRHVQYGRFYRSARTRLACNLSNISYTDVCTMRRGFPLHPVLRQKSRHLHYLCALVQSGVALFNI